MKCWNKTNDRLWRPLLDAPTNGLGALEISLLSQEGGTQLFGGYVQGEFPKVVSREWVFLEK